MPGTPADQPCEVDWPGKKRKKQPKRVAPAAPEASTAQQPTAPPKKKQRGGDIIDSIFGQRIAKASPQASGEAASAAEAAGPSSGKQRPAAQGGQVAVAAKPSRKRQQQKLAATLGTPDDLFGNGAGISRRRDNEGLRIYSTEELNVGKGGDTSMCPFDCECCF